MKYLLTDVEKCLQRKSWWAVFFILPIARRLSLLVANKTELTPNQITVGAFFLIVPSAILYAQGDYVATVIAVILFELNYLFDCIDGTIARLKGSSSPVGGYLDAILDRVRILGLCIALGLGQWHATHSVDFLFWLILYLGINNLIIISRGYQERTLSKIGVSSRLGSDLLANQGDGFLNSWFGFTRRRNLMPYFHDVELDALVFVVGPLLKSPLVFVQVAVGAGLILLIALNVVFLRGISRRKTAGG